MSKGKDESENNNLLDQSTDLNKFARIVRVA